MAVAPALLLLLSFAAQAAGLAQLDARVHRLLDDDAGWSLHHDADDNGITIYRKDIPHLGVTAFKGEKTLDPRVSPERMFRVITDVGSQKRFSPLLLETKVVESSGRELAYYQVMKPPPMVPGSERYWINTGVIHRDLGGEKGRLKRAWSAAPDGALPDVHADLQQRYPKGVEVEITHGSWELDPQPDGTVRYIYRTVTHPGGNVPTRLARMLSSRSLPDNMMRFEQAALP